jgi:hypothetical protein
MAFPLSEASFCDHFPRLLILWLMETQSGSASFSMDRVSCFIKWVTSQTCESNFNSIVHRL